MCITSFCEVGPVCLNLLAKLIFPYPEFCLYLRQNPAAGMPRSLSQGLAWDSAKQKHHTVSLAHPLGAYEDCCKIHSSTSTEHTESQRFKEEKGVNLNNGYDVISNNWGFTIDTILLQTS